MNNKYFICVDLLIVCIYLLITKKGMVMYD